MFKHSVKVPRLYKVAATIAKEVSEGLGSIKQLVYEKQKKHPNIKALYALVATLFQRTEELDTILKRSQFLTKESRLDIWLAKILIVELIWGRKILPGQSKPESTVRAYEQIFKAHLSDDKTNPSEIVDIQVKLKPRYVRVNSLVLTLNEAVEGFRDEGWILSKFLDKTDYQGFLNKITSLKEDEFLVDIHIPNLLIFPPKTQFYNHPAYKNGSIILQDKASCLPVHILGPTPGSKVLDMCAAPGMKTTHLAAVLNDEGTVYAVERDPRRFEILNKMIESSKATCIKSFNKDVLTCTAKELTGVDYILVDPSCSGSGMTDRLDSNVKNEQSRLEKLTGFQIKILRSALTKFPDAKRVVYSTCSVYPEENEDVVRQVLETNYNFKLVPAQQFVGDTWHNFGSSEYGEIGKYCLYAKPIEDFTNGFFVAVFERLKEGEENQFFNTRIFNFKKHIQARERRKDKKRKLEDSMQNDGTNQQENNEHSEEHTVPEVEELNVEEPRKKKRQKEGNEEGRSHSGPHDNEVVDYNQLQEFDVIKGKQKKPDVFGDEVAEEKLKKKHKKKHKKREESEINEPENQKIEESSELNVVDKIESTSGVEEIKMKKKKKKQKHMEHMEIEITQNGNENRISCELATVEANETTSEASPRPSKSKTKKKHGKDRVHEISEDSAAAESEIKKRKKRECHST